MRTLKVIDNDYVLENGRLVWVEGIDALAQIIKNRLSLGLGEWFLALEEGVDWLGILNQKVFFQERLITQLKTAIRKEPSVSNIDFITAEFQRKTRSVSVDFQLRTTEGLLNGTEVIEL